MENLIGQTIGNYRIISALGQGGMGVVYQAYQIPLRRYVALKMLRGEMAHDETFVARLLREARLAAGLKHNHIVRVYEVSRAAPYFIAMEFIDGEPLSALLERERLLNPTRAAELARQIASALDYAHARKIIHRDIKPANILIERGTGRAVLSDFGIARALASSHFSRPDQMLGTPEYMAPELAHGDEATAQSDNYALGILLYELLTGRTPFQGATSTVILDQHVRAPIPPLRQFNPTLPEPIEVVIARGLAKDPSERYASAGELAQAFVTALGVTPISTPLSYRPATHTQSKQPFILLAIAGSVVAIILILLLLLVRQTPVPANPAAPQAIVTIVPTSIARVPQSLPSVVTATPAEVVTRVFSTPTTLPTNTAPVEGLNPNLVLTPTYTATTTATATNTPVTPTNTRTVPPTTAGPVPPDGSKYFPPQQLAPENKTVFKSEHDMITLKWTSVGALDADEFYAVDVFGPPDQRGNDVRVCRFVIKETQVTLPAQESPPCDSDEWAFNDVGDFKWRVYIVVKDTPFSELQISAFSPFREFGWHF